MSIPDYRILFADTYVEQLLGYSSEELRQSNIGILCGPRTNVAMLKSCTMEGEMVSIQYPAQLILYTRQLEPKRIMVHTKSIGHASCANFCRLLTFSKSEAVLLSDSVQNSNRQPRVILSPNPPFLMSIFNDIFSITFGIDKENLRSLLSLPIRVVACPRETADAWTRPFLMAAAGSVCESTVYTRTTFCGDYPFKLRCEPVVLSENGKVAFVAATFLSLMPEIHSQIATNISFSAELKGEPHNSASACLPGSLAIGGGTLTRGFYIRPSALDDGAGVQHIQYFAAGFREPSELLGLRDSQSLSEGLTGHLAASVLLQNDSDVESENRRDIAPGSDGRPDSSSSDRRVAADQGHAPPSSGGDTASLAAPSPKRRRAGRPQRSDDVAALLARGDHTLLRRIRRRHAAADRRAAMLGGEGAAVPRP